MTLGSHVLPWRQTGPQTRRLASARRSPLLQFKRSVGIAVRVDPDPMCSTSFGDDCTGPPAPSCLGENALVDNRAAGLKSCLPSLEMRTAMAASGLLPIGEISTATKTTLNQPPLWLSTEETNCKKTPTSHISYDNSFCYLPAASSCRRIIETKSGENMTFDSGGFQGRLRACPFLGSWRALRCVEVYVMAG